MTDAIYLRCGKTVNQAALEALIAGNIPESHCCCEEIHIDIAHKLHDCPLVSDLAIRNLRRALDPPDIVRYGDLPTLRVVFPDIKDDEKNKLLHIAMTSKNLPVITFLLDSGVDANIIDDDRKTPLMRAAENGSTDFVLALLHYGARPEDRSDEGFSALMYAVRNGHRAASEIIFKKLASVTIDAAINGETSIDEKNRESCATALHDLWIGFKDSENEDRMLYLQRAMELDPGNHIYAEEIQAYYDDQEDTQSNQTYVSVTGMSQHSLQLTRRRIWESI
jgi:hypothetical protein